MRNIALQSWERMFLVIVMTMFVVSFQQTVLASPFGQGVFGADVPFGSATSLSIALGGNVSFNLNPGGGTFSGNGSHTITVTSTDVAGYKLYVYSPTSTNMTFGAQTIPASSNTSGAALSTNTWGYNTDGSSNYLGMQTIPALIKDTNVPAKTGDNTTVKYAVLTDLSQTAGAYSVSVVYTAVANND